MGNQTSDNRRVLIVDDNHAIHEDFRKILEITSADDAWRKKRSSFFNESFSQAQREGFELSSVYQGGQALAKVTHALETQMPFAIVFLDVRMPPGMDGVSTARELWEIDPRLQIVLCTAYSDYTLEDIHTRVTNLNNLLILKKPFDTIVVQQVAEALSRKWNLMESNHAQNRQLRHACEQLVRRIEEKQEADHALQTSEDRLKTVLRCTHMGVWSWNAERQSMTIDAGMARLLELPPDTTVCDLSSLMSLFGNQQTNKFIDHLSKNISSDGDFEIEMSIDNAYETRHLEFRGSGSEVNQQEGGEFFGLCWDITRRVRAEHTLQYLSTRDPLTDLANRKIFIERIEHVIEWFKQNQDQSQKAQHLYLIFIDLDDFKVINDSRGHLLGDQLLQHIARRMSEVVDPDDCFSRLGGDEFGLMYAKPISMELLSEKIHMLYDRLASPFDINQEDFYINASMGVVELSDRYQSAMDVLRDADSAMYESKRLGKNRWTVFDNRMLETAMKLDHMSNKLRRAIPSGEFQLHFQPIMRLSDQSCCASEALLRWFPKQMNPVSPAEFIPVAEKNGFIHELGLWVLRMACQYTTESNHNQMVSVNLSPIQLYHNGFVEEVVQLLDQTKLDPARLKLEITESAVMRNPNVAIKVLNQLRELGASIWLDDFGTGYSSLSYLSNLPLSGLKIDRSFVTKMHDSKRDYNLVKTIISMSQDMNLEVVAEGIETEEQLQMLKDMNCVMGQGYLLGRPAPLSASLYHKS